MQAIFGKDIDRIQGTGRLWQNWWVTVARKVRIEAHMLPVIRR
jgi:hypothetical protein